MARGLGLHGAGRQEEMPSVADGGAAPASARGRPRGPADGLEGIRGWAPTNPTRCGGVFRGTPGQEGASSGPKPSVWAPEIDMGGTVRPQPSRALSAAPMRPTAHPRAWGNLSSAKGNSWCPGCGRDPFWGWRNPPLAQLTRPAVWPTVVVAVGSEGTADGPLSPLRQTHDDQVILGQMAGGVTGGWVPGGSTRAEPGPYFPGTPGGDAGGIGTGGCPR